MGIKDKNIFDSIRRNNPYFEDMISRSVYNSNAIEGNTLSYAETYALLFNDNTLKVKGTPREIYEAINLKYALSYIFHNIDARLNTEMLINIAKYINKNINEINGFRTVQVMLRGSDHIPPKAYDISRLVSKLIYEYEKSFDEDIYMSIANFHIKFERIHPFIDGNGRTGRAIIQKELLRYNRAPAIITIDSRAEYLKYLETQDIVGLAKLLRILSKNEEDRLNKFKISYFFD